MQARPIAVKHSYGTNALLSKEFYFLDLVVVYRMSTLVPVHCLKSLQSSPGSLVSILESLQAPLSYLILAQDV